jgi:hypothetical protein
MSFPSISEPQALHRHYLRWRTYLPPLFAAGWIVFDLLLLATSVFPRQIEPTDWWLIPVLSLVFAQLSYGGLWAAFGPGKAAVRIPLVLGGTALATAAFFRQVVFRNELEIRFIVFFLGILMLFQTLLFGLGLLVQWLLALQAAWEGENETSREKQFGVRDILYWMVGVGLLITICRFAFRNVQFGAVDSGEIVEDLLIAAVLIFSTLSQALLAGWVAFPPEGKRLRWLLGFIASLFLAALAGAPIAVGWESTEEFLSVFALLVLQYLLVWSLLSFLAWQGLRLVER